MKLRKASSLKQLNIRGTKIFNFLSKNYLVKAFGSFSLSQVINALSSFAILLLYTRALLPADFGKVTLIWVFITIISMLIDSGLNTAFSIKFYKIPKEENIKNIYSIFIYILVVFSLLYYLFLFFPSLFLKISRVQVATSELTIIFLLMLAIIFGRFYTNMLMISLRPKNYFFTTLVFNIVLVISSFIYLVVRRSGYISYFKAYLLAYFTISILGLRFFVINYKPAKNQIISLANLKGLLKLGLPLVPNSVMLMLLIWADRYILNLYVSLAVVGIYSVGYRFAGIINSFIIDPFGQAMAPINFKLFAKSLSEYKGLMAKVMNYYWLIFFGIMIGYFTILGEVFRLFIDIKYIEGYNIVGMVLIGAIIWGITNYLGSTVVMKEKTGKMLLFTSISVFLNIGLNFMLIPRYGMYAAAATTLISYMLQFIMILKYTQKLVWVNYDYGFIFKSIVFSLSFFAIILFLSFLKINIGIMLGLKIVVFLLFILISYRLFDVKKFIKEILSYDIISKQTAG